MAKGHTTRRQRSATGSSLDTKSALGKDNKQERQSDSAELSTGRPALAYIGWITGLISFVGGGVGLLPVDFWLGVICVYIGVVAFAVAVVLEPQLRARGRWLQVTGLVVVVAIGVLFTLRVVLEPAPLKCSAYTIEGDYAEGTDVGGIKWQSGYLDLRVTINNPTNRDYDDLDLSIKPNRPTNDIGQISSVPGVSFLPDTVISHADTWVQATEAGTGKQVTMPLRQEARDEPYRVRCDKLPAHSTLQVVIAVVNANLGKREASGKGLVLYSFVPRYGPKSKPTTVEVKGQYKSRSKPYDFKETLSVE